MEDVFQRILAASDPFIFSCQKFPVYQLKSLSAVATILLYSSSADKEEEQDNTVSSSAFESETDEYAYDLDDNHFLMKFFFKATNTFQFYI